MTEETLKIVSEFEAAIDKYGYGLSPAKKEEPVGGFRAFIEFAKSINEPFPITLERQKEIEELIAQERRGR